jgi:thymidine phosphorylase
VGDHREAGDALFTIYAKDRAAASAAETDLMRGIAFSKRPVSPLPLFYRTLRS